jgi:hypothetical protein
MSVFLSHSSKDKAFVRKLLNDLQQEGVPVWIDEVELRAGDSLSAIWSGIRDSGCLLVVLSTAARESGWVEKEIELAKSMDGVRIVPVLLEDINGGWGGELAEKSIADFRNPSEYRRAFYRLVNAIKGLPNPVLLTAKQAARKIKEEVNPSGELFGLSQQGVATLYSLTNRRDWIFADTTNGESRLWIGEFYDPGIGCVQAYVVMDGHIHSFPDLFLLDSDPHPVKDSYIVYSCSMSELRDDSDPNARLTREGLGNRLTKIEKRYTRFRPVPIKRTYIDSTAAVLSATENGHSKAVLGESPEDLFTLTKLECDKRHGGFLVWKVSFFDPTLAESVLTVGVDAVTGEIKYPSMYAELLNVAFTHIREEDGHVVLSVASLPKALAIHDWDIMLPWEYPKKYLTGGMLSSWHKCSLVKMRPSLGSLRFFQTLV